MKIKSEKEQLRERCNYIDQLISWQDIAMRKARKRYDIKSNWLLSFWIGSNTDTLWFVYEREKGIKDNLQDYLDLINDKLINCS